MSAVIPIFFAILYVAGVEPYDSTVAYMVGGLIAALIIAWSLRPNIRRLLKGEERLRITSYNVCYTKLLRMSPVQCIQ